MLDLVGVRKCTAHDGKPSHAIYGYDWCAWAATKLAFQAWHYGVVIHQEQQDSRSGLARERALTPLGSLVMVTSALLGLASERKSTTTAMTP